MIPCPYCAGTQVAAETSDVFVAHLGYQISARRVCKCGFAAPWSPGFHGADDAERRAKQIWDDVASLEIWQ